MLTCLGSLPGLGLADGISAKGMTGGLVIPTGEVVPDRGLAVSYGNYRESYYGNRNTQQNMLLGFGILDNVEAFARFADYADAPPGVWAHNRQYGHSTRDLSVNLKLKIPYLPRRGPQLAVGIKDAAGGNPLFTSTYAVATQHWRSLSGSVGYVQDRQRHATNFDGFFGGLEWRNDLTGLSLLAEYYGETQHIGGRWRSPELKTLGDLSLEATAQRAFGETLPDGRSDDATLITVTLHWPVGNLDTRRKQARPSPMFAKPAVSADLADTAKQPEASARNEAAAEPLLESSRFEQLATLRRKLVDRGLERVRVGLRGDSTMTELVVEYENHRYAQNEADALGLVFGWASELAPPGIQRVRAVTLKDGLQVYETGVGVSAFRDFLRQGSADLVRDGLTWRSGRSPAEITETTWEQDAPTKTTRLRFEIRPDLVHTMGTEVGAFDYALATRGRLVAPLWAGARLTSEYLIPIDHSLNMEDGRAFSNLRQSRGLENVTLGQSFWLGRRILLHTAAGRYHFDSWGAQSEATAFVPGTSDMIRLKGVMYHPEPGGVTGGDRAGTISYRRFWGPGHWTEIGVQRFSDGSSGPTLEWTRWSSDLGVTMFGRWGGNTRFAGLKLTAPLTPRRGMKPRVATVAGPAHHSQSMRSMIISPGSSNLVQPSWVRELTLVTDLEREYLSGGRINQPYLESQLYRMREAFYRFGE